MQCIVAVRERRALWWHENSVKPTAALRTWDEPFAVFCASSSSLKIIVAVGRDELAGDATLWERVLWPTSCIHFPCHLS